MIQSFDFMNEKIVASGRRRIAVAVAQNEDVLLSIDKASALGIAEPIHRSSTRSLKPAIAAESEPSNMKSSGDGRRRGVQRPFA